MNCDSPNCILLILKIPTWFGLDFGHDFGLFHCVYKMAAPAKSNRLWVWSSSTFPENFNRICL